MIVSQCGFLDLMERDAQFVIPAYQRLYSWTTMQCEELWLDILRAARAEHDHFLGTVLFETKDDSGGARVLEIIDGQQRLTTVSLILLTLCQYLDAHPETAQAAGLNSGVLRAAYLMNAHAPSGNAKAKLMPSRHDAAVYELVLGGGQADAESVIAKNMTFFQQKMEEGSFDPQQLTEGLGRLQIVLVEVEDQQEAQPIFESINSKGMPLNVADMVRNYLLLAESHEDQARLYEEYWKPIQEMFVPDPGSLKLNTGIKSWLSVRLKGARILSTDQVYSSFKKYVEDVYQGEKEPILRELRGFSLMWAENFRYHGVKKFRSGSDWAQIGAPTLTAHYQLKPAQNEEYARKLREELKNADSRW